MKTLKIQIQMRYSTGKQCFGNVEKSGKWRNGGDWFSNPHPWSHAFKEHIWIFRLSDFMEMTIQCHVTGFVTLVGITGSD